MGVCVWGGGGGGGGGWGGSIFIFVLYSLHLWDAVLYNKVLFCLFFLPTRHLLKNIHSNRKEFADKKGH